MVNQVLEKSQPPSSPAPCLRVSVPAPSSILRTHFQVPYPATPLFATLTKTGGVCTQNSQFGNAHLTLLGSRLWPERTKRGRSMLRPHRRIQRSGFDLVGGGVPGDGGLAEIGFVGHVAGQRGVVAEDGVFGYLLAIPHALEVLPEMRFFLVPGDAAISEPFGDRFFAGLGVMILVPFLEIGIAHGVWVAVGVIARGLVFAGLREISDRGFRDFENAL